VRWVREAEVADCPTFQTFQTDSAHVPIGSRRRREQSVISYVTLAATARDAAESFAEGVEPLIERDWTRAGIAGGVQTALHKEKRPGHFCPRRFGRSVTDEPSLIGI
jgi:hypothetical protein